MFDIIYRKIYYNDLTVKLNFFEILVECVQRISSECDIWLILKHISSIKYKHIINKMWRFWNYITFLIQTNILSNIQIRSKYNVTAKAWAFKKNIRKYLIFHPMFFSILVTKFYVTLSDSKYLQAHQRYLTVQFIFFVARIYKNRELSMLSMASSSYWKSHSSKSWAQDNHCVAASPITMIAIFGIEITPPAARTTSRLFIIT